MAFGALGDLVKGAGSVVRKIGGAFGERRGEFDEDARRRDDQLNQAQRLLLERAQGRGPSAAAEQLKSGLQQNLAHAVSTARSGRPGGSSALSAMQAQQTQGRLGAGISGQLAQLRSQEQLAAQQQLAAYLASLYGSDVAAAGAKAGIPTAGEQMVGVGTGLLSGILSL